jgi:hypothetical protein
MIRGLIIAPFGGLLLFFLGQILLPVWICVILGIAVAGFLVYIAVFSENIYFELDDDGTFRYHKMGKLQNTFELSKYRIGYHRKTEWGILGDNNIKFKLQDEQGEQTDIEAGPLGTKQFNEMFEAMEQYSIKDIETLEANKNKE